MKTSGPTGRGRWTEPRTREQEDLGKPQVHDAGANEEQGAFSVWRGRRVTAGRGCARGVAGRGVPVGGGLPGQPGRGRAGGDAGRGFEPGQTAQRGQQVYGRGWATAQGANVCARGRGAGARRANEGGSAAEWGRVVEPRDVDPPALRDQQGFGGPRKHDAGYGVR
jgi:hypothetical protein